MKNPSPFPIILSVWHLLSLVTVAYHVNNVTDNTIVISNSIELNPRSQVHKLDNITCIGCKIQLDITGKLQSGVDYAVTSLVRLRDRRGQGFKNNVRITLSVQDPDLPRDYYVPIASSQGTDKEWIKLEGTFHLNGPPSSAVIYVEGLNRDSDIILKTLVVKPEAPQVPSQSTTLTPGMNKRNQKLKKNIIRNPSFKRGLNNWSGTGCRIELLSCTANGNVLPKTGNYFAAATGRAQEWNGLQQEITERVERKLAYHVTAVVRINGNNVASARLLVTLWVQMQDLRHEFITISNRQVTDKGWQELSGKFLLNGYPKRVVIYFEGPPPGVDILLNHLVIKHAESLKPVPPPLNSAFGVNIIHNTEMSDGTNGWFIIGNCTLSVRSRDAQLGLPSVSDPDSSRNSQPLIDKYMLVTNRTGSWMGPAQYITDKVQPFLTYQVFAWVKTTGSGSTGPQIVNVAISVDGQWVNAGKVETTTDKWSRVFGSFRLEKKPSDLMVYIQGPDSGVDLMVAGLQIFAVDRKARFNLLQKKIEKVRKRDVILKFTGIENTRELSTSVKVEQTQNSFPIGSCISRSSIDNEDFVDFFVKNFNWAVFANELKWYSTEPERGQFNYGDSDYLLNFCEKHNKNVRGHCLFWEVEDAVQPWVKALDNTELTKAIQDHLTGLVTRYKGKFKHYDVDNEMLHGSFFKDRLGEDIQTFMFKKTYEVDNCTTLFVNDYNVEDGKDERSSPARLAKLVRSLMERGARVGGIGLQGHIDSPIGSIVCSALNKLGRLNIPIWFTELDVSSSNEYVRAEDLEVMLREAFAHPKVEGVMLWGFWELMSRENSHLVNAEGDINEAGKRYLALRQEWLSHFQGVVDRKLEYSFRGFHGTYNVQIARDGKNVTKTIVVDKGDSPLVLSIDLGS